MPGTTGTTCGLGTEGRTVDREVRLVRSVTNGPRSRGVRATTKARRGTDRVAEEMGGRNRFARVADEL
ncbi:hypothetical protein DP107_10315 [Haloglomus irregulare]|uniref:Uncharacterized protein n=1 Tax=Haloglomus irregulare TaxID=2234134 RepID=A0A554N9E4_9EURY|nr:hypothetical protein DP107_10315 [Haloglomus irregulare]